MPARLAQPGGDIHHPRHARTPENIDDAGVLQAQGQQPQTAATRTGRRSVPRSGVADAELSCDKLLGIKRFFWIILAMVAGEGPQRRVSWRFPTSPISRMPCRRPSGRPLSRLRRSEAHPRPFPASHLDRARRRARSHRLVLQRLSRPGPESRRAGRHARGASTRPAPARAAPATSPAPPTITSSWRPSWPTCTARKRRCCSPPAMSPTRRRWRPCRRSCRA